MKTFFKKTGFTLAENLITLTIIGIIASITIPALIKKHNEKTWATAKNIFENKLEIAVKQMNTEEKLAGYASTIDFVNELKKYIKIDRICNNNNITKCFEKEITWNLNDDEKVDMSGIKNAASLGQSDWKTETVGVQFNNGINAIIAYNPNTPQEPYNNQFAATSNSMAILYDVSGNKNPNTNGKDIASINVVGLSETLSCIFDTGDLCWSEDFLPTPIDTCNGISKYDQEYTTGKYCSKNAWAGAKKTCEISGMKLPTMEQLAQLTNDIYVYSSTGSSIKISAYGSANNLQIKNKYKDILTFPTGYWSENLYSAAYESSASMRVLYPTRTYHTFTNKGHMPNYSNDTRAICVSIR